MTLSAIKQRAFLGEEGGGEDGRPHTVTVGEEGRDKADDKKGQRGSWCRPCLVECVCVCVCGWSGFYFFSWLQLLSLCCCCCCCSVCCSCCCYTLFLCRNSNLLHFSFAMRAHTHTCTCHTHTHVLATHTARCSENFAVKLASLLKQTKFA